MINYHPSPSKGCGVIIGLGQWSQTNYVSESSGGLVKTWISWLRLLEFDSAGQRHGPGISFSTKTVNDMDVVG